MAGDKQAVVDVEGEVVGGGDGVHHKEIITVFGACSAGVCALCFVIGTCIDHRPLMTDRRRI